MAYVPCRELQKLTTRQKQKCPLCGSMQTIMMRGFTADIETGEFGLVGDRGYSFCNCRNIFFTDWRNIQMDGYDNDYIERTKSGENERKTRLVEIEKQWALVRRLKPDAKSLLNVGDYDDVFLDYLKRSDWDRMNMATLDIIPRESRHRLITANFEDWESDEKFDIIWMSHLIEHVKNPKAVMLKAKRMLNPNGIIFVATPDTHHINWENPLEWMNWIVEQHHTLWNVYDWASFVEEECGLKCIHKTVSFDVIDLKYENGSQSYYWIKEGRTIFTTLE